MARSTTLAVWRSQGGDNTRTVTPAVMSSHVTFYIANAAASGNLVSTSNATAPAVILPANAIVTSITLTTAGTGNVNFGYTPIVNPGPGQNTTLGTPVPTAFMANAVITSRAVFNLASSGAGTSMSNVANATNLSVMTYAANTSASGAIAGYISYFVADDGKQSR